MKRVVLAFLLAGLLISSAGAQPIIFVVRHAEKADKSKDTDLSKTGFARAKVLAQMLKDAGITSVFATEFKRTRETAAPAAKALGIRVHVRPAGQKAALAAELKRLTGNALVVGHGNTIPALVKALGIEEPIRIDENNYTDLFVVVLGKKPRLIRLHYP